jgi:hypothetical protein
LLAYTFLNFKDKGALVAAVFEYNSDILEKYVHKLCEQDDVFSVSWKYLPTNGVVPDPIPVLYR